MTDAFSVTTTLVVEIISILVGIARRSSYVTTSVFAYWDSSSSELPRPRVHGIRKQGPKATIFLSFGFVFDGGLSAN
jgi:hypothetical protein